MKPLRDSIALRQIPTFIQGQNVAGFGFWLEMHLEAVGIELVQHQFDAIFDGRWRSVAGDKFLDHGHPMASQVLGEPVCGRTNGWLLKCGRFLPKGEEKVRGLITRYSTVIWKIIDFGFIVAFLGRQ